MSRSLFNAAYRERCRWCDLIHAGGPENCDAAEEAASGSAGDRPSYLKRSARVIRMAADAAESHGRDVQCHPRTARVLAGVLEELNEAIVGIARLKRAIITLADEMDRSAIAVPPSAEEAVRLSREEPDDATNPQAWTAWHLEHGR